MILLKKFSKIIPSYRHRTDIHIFDNSFYNFNYPVYHKKIHTINLIKRKKSLFKSFYFSLNVNFQKNLSLITKNYTYVFKPYKKIIICQTLTGENYFYPGIENLNIGKIILPQCDFLSYPTKFLSKGFFTYL
jgi:hypothetical protein